MRLRAAIVLVFATAICAAPATQLVADQSPLAADAPAAVGQIFPIQTGDTNCPVAKEVLETCPGLPRVVYLKFEKARGRFRKAPGYVSIFGEVDLVSCAPYTLIHVVKVAKYDGPPPECPPPPCFPPACTPG